MYKNIASYVLTVALLGVAVYLESPLVATAIVALWAVNASESVLTRKNRDADILEMQASLAAYKAKLGALEMSVTNVAERARTILGETY